MTLDDDRYTDHFMSRALDKDLRALAESVKCARCCHPIALHIPHDELWWDMCAVCIALDRDHCGGEEIGPETDPAKRGQYTRGNFMASVGVTDAADVVWETDASKITWHHNEPEERPNEPNAS